MVDALSAMEIHGNSNSLIELGVMILIILVVYGIGSATD